MALGPTCVGTPEDRGERPIAGRQPPWGQYSMPSDFEKRVLDFVSTSIIKNQKKGSVWNNKCNVVPNRHPYTEALYKQQMPSIQQVQYFLSGYSLSGDVYTLQDTCGWVYKKTGEFVLADWYSDVANNYNNALNIKGRITGPSNDPYFSKSYPTNLQVSEVIFNYVLSFWNARFRNLIGSAFDKLASDAVDAANAKCSSSVGTPPPTPTVPVTEGPNPPANNGTYVLDNRGNPIPSRNQSRPVPRPAVKPTVTRNQSQPVSRPPFKPTVTRNQAVPVPPKTR